MISDTHGLLRPQAVAALRGCELIIHAGDVGAPEILAELRLLARVVAVRGNVDRGAWAEALPARTVVRVQAMTICVLHDLADLGEDPAEAGYDIVISGHSHISRVERRHGVLFLNPGAAGPRRFKLPISVARLSLAGGRARVRIVELAV